MRNEGNWYHGGHLNIQLFVSLEPTPPLPLEFQPLQSVRGVRRLSSAAPSDPAACICMNAMGEERTTPPHQQFAVWECRAWELHLAGQR
jgi:hypothetical protein